MNFENGAPSSVMSGGKGKARATLGLTAKLRIEVLKEKEERRRG